MSQRNLLFAIVLLFVGFCAGRFSESPQANAQTVAMPGGAYQTLYTSSEDGKTVYAWAIGREGQVPMNDFINKCAPMFVGKVEANQPAAAPPVNPRPRRP